MGLGSEIQDPKKPISDLGSRVKKAPDPVSGTLILGKKKILHAPIFLPCSRHFVHWFFLNLYFLSEIIGY